jgi:hypothetical protein
MFKFILIHQYLLLTGYKSMYLNHYHAILGLQLHLVNLAHLYSVFILFCDAKIFVFISKNASASGGLRPPDPLTRGLPLDPTGA